MYSIRYLLYSRIIYIYIYLNDFIFVLFSHYFVLLSLFHIFDLDVRMYVRIDVSPFFSKFSNTGNITDFISTNIAANDILIVR